MSSLSTPLPFENLLASLNWRYATKQFDASKKIPSDTWSVLEESLVLTPSSFGLQPWKFLIIESPGVREQLLPHTWGQKQVVEASHVVVFTIPTTVDEAWVDRFLARQAEVRNTPVESFAGYRKVVVGFLDRLDPAARQNWASRQVYIALGQLMASAAVLGIDACPIEGFIPGEYDNVLGLAKKGLASVVVCALGYRSEDDKYAHLPKVRFSANESIERI